MVDDLVDHLNAQGYSADRLHGDMTQPMRDRVMQKFRKSGLEFLVATDVAARGIDVDDVQVVFNYDLPYDPEDYVHRIGRTGRAGKSGRAVSFVAGRELFQIQNIERFTKMRIQRAKVPTADEVEEARANVFVEKLRSTLQSGEFKKQDRLCERLLEEGFNSTDIASALIHLLQSGEAAPAAAAPSREQESPSRGGYSDRGEAPRSFSAPAMNVRGKIARPYREERSRETRAPYREERAPRRDFPPAPARRPSAPAREIAPPAAVAAEPSAPESKQPVAAASEAIAAKPPSPAQSKRPFAAPPGVLAPKSPSQNPNAHSLTQRRSRKRPAAARRTNKPVSI